MERMSGRATAVGDPMLTRPHGARAGIHGSPQGVRPDLRPRPHASLQHHVQHLFQGAIRSFPERLGPKDERSPVAHAENTINNLKTPLQSH